MWRRSQWPAPHAFPGPAGHERWSELEVRSDHLFLRASRCRSWVKSALSIPAGRIVALRLDITRAVLLGRDLGLN